MKTLQLNSKHFLTRSVILLILLLSVTTIFSQHKNDTSQYLPQISLMAINGFGPYILGTPQENVFLAYDLPDQTSKVTFRFIDVDHNQVGTSYTEEGSSLTSSSWCVELDTFDLPLSPQVNVEITYKTDSIANYFVAYTVFPDTVIFKATEGWGPFITNNYPLTNTSWQPVPELYNTFTVTNLPPRTDTLEFKIITADSTVIDSFFVYAPTGQYLDSAVFPNVRMDSLPLSTRYFQTVIHCNGAPKYGLEFHKDLTVIPQKPKLISKSEYGTLNDSIGTFIQNQIAGHALLVEDDKYATILNGSGERMDEPPYNYKGPYSLDLINDEFTIEAWIKIDIDKIIKSNSLDRDSLDWEHFMEVDSVWYFDFIVDNDAYLYVGSIFADGYIYWINIQPSALQGAEWHHIAFVKPEGLNHCFYWDGNNIGGYVTNNYYTLANSNYKDYLKTGLLSFGGSNDWVGQPTLITAIDEVRIWNRVLSGEEIKNNFQKTILQDKSLTGYWNFNDLRNHLNIITDISYHNNPGRLHKGATFIPQYPYVQKTFDTIVVISSNALTDSIKYSFIDENNKVVDSAILSTQNSTATLIYDISALPYKISHLRISEYYPDNTDYDLRILPSPPIATPQYNWATYYYSQCFDLFTPVTVSGFPEKTEKVVVGLMNEDQGQISDTVSLFSNSIPYNHSLTLNGTDNYIETSQSINSPGEFTLMFWFKTNTKEGGKLIGFTDTLNGINPGDYDRQVIMKKDGSLNFSMKVNDTLHSLNASNIYNDGVWHHVAAVYDPGNGGKLFIDGSPVDKQNPGAADSYSGYWIIGRNHEAQTRDPESISEYFQGSLAEISIWDLALSYVEINNYRFSSLVNYDLVYYYKLNDNSDTTVHDSKGNNTGNLKGSEQKWNFDNTISFVQWNKNIIAKDTGIYNFFANVFYAGGPDTGVIYPLGKYIIKYPQEEFNLYYSLDEGQGPFNEGTELINTFYFDTDYDQSNQPGWQNNFVKCLFLSPDHIQLFEDMVTSTIPHCTGIFYIDMGVAPPGSYLNIQFGYHDQQNVEHITDDFSFPIYMRPIVPPIVAGDFGPFDQAIIPVPGIMERENTFVITTEVYSDLNRVLGKFYDHTGCEIATKDGVQINDTSWHITYDMAQLSPPFTQMKIEYYLGSEPVPALVQGPFKITIRKTRPVWFDFLPATSFSDISQVDDSVTFTVDTPFEESHMINNSESMEIPEWIPLIGGSKAEMESPTAKAYLKYIVPDYKLELNEPPVFFQKVFNLGAGTAETFRLGFNYSQNNTYEIDSNNNLLATQNFSRGGSVTSGFEKLENIVTKVKEMIELAEIGDPIVRPAFSITATGSFEYSSRQHLMIDTISGKWGSFGNLEVDANPNHEDAYKNSASFKFYSGALGIEFSLGFTLLEGLVDAYFGLDGRFVLGFGNSYTTIPQNSTRALKSFAFQTYGRSYITAFWGWYEKTVWGPQLFYSTTIWGDDMTDCFPPLGKNEHLPLAIKANSSWPELGDEIKPISYYSKMPLSYPQAAIISSDHYTLFSWIERGNTYGERHLRARYLGGETKKFSDKLTIETNNHAINSPVSEAINKNTCLLTWAQTRHTSETILGSKYADVVKEFVQTQDIWYAVYDIESDSLILMDMVDDSITTIICGRAEAHPLVTVLSDTKALITWQVGDIETHISDIWYVLLEKQDDTWIASTPAVITEIEGIETDLKIASPKEDLAVMVWMNTEYSDPSKNKIMTSVFTDFIWSEPEILFDQADHYYNYLDMNFKNETGAVVWTSYIEDTANNHFETLSLLTWDPDNDQWSSELPVKLLVDSSNHLQYPGITINEDGSTAIAVKVEKIITKTAERRISQVDLVVGNLNSPSGAWDHIVANEYICDTTKQVSDICLSYIGEDTLMILSHEYVMLPTNSPFEPKNGIMFGDPYMNLVLRSFKIEGEEIENINENEYFVDIDEIFINESDLKLYQNFPNPCIDQTTIRFYIPHDSHIKLEVYNMTGFNIAILIDQRLTTGQYEVNLNTSLLDPGTYIYKLTTDDSMSTLRMIVGN